MGESDSRQHSALCDRPRPSPLLLVPQSYSSSFSFSIFDRRSLAEVCAEQRRIHELRQRMRLLTANDIEEEDDDEDEDDRRGEGSIDQSLQMRNSSVSKRRD